MSGSFDARTRPCFETAYQALVRRALAGERFTFPVDLAAPALTAHSQPLTEAERAETQRWALALSRVADPDARQVRLATAPVRRHRRFGMIWLGGWGGRRGGPRAAELNRLPG